jgi:hypothetical protein
MTQAARPVVRQITGPAVRMEHSEKELANELQVMRDPGNVSTLQ